MVPIFNMPSDNGCCGTFLSLSNRRQGMDGQQPATPEPTKTPVMWMGSKQRLQKIDIREIPVMSSTIRTVDTVQDLGSRHW